MGIPYIIVAIVALIMAIVMRPKLPSQKPDSVDDDDVPKAEPGAAIPWAFGDILLTSPNVVWYGDQYIDRTGGDNQYSEYYLGMHLVICQSPINSITAIEAGERLAWSGNVTANTQIYINRRDLFGERKKEGGIKGYVDLEFGGDTQAANSYLVSKLGNTVSGNRGVVAAVLRKVYLSANSPYIKPWAFRVTNYPGADFAPLHNIVGGAANGALIIREIWTNPAFGMGKSSSTIDSTYMAAAAATLHAEGFGLSGAFTKIADAESLINEVCKHINAVFQLNMQTGKMALVLLRDDYNPATLASFDDSSILSHDSFERPTYYGLVNEISVTYRPRGTRKDDVTSAHHSGLIQMNGGRVISQSVAFGLCDSLAYASHLAARELKQATTPTARVTFKVNRKAWKIPSGGVVKYSNSRLGVVDLIMRVIKVDYGTLDSNAVSITAIEDVFAKPVTNYIQEQPPIDDGTDIPPAAAVNVYGALETPYPLLAQRFGFNALSLLNTAAGHVTLLCGHEANSTAFNYFTKGYVVYDVGGNVISPTTYDDNGEGQYATRVNVVGTPGYSSSIGYSGTAENAARLAAGQIVIASTGETMQIETVTPSTSTTGTLTVKRGCMDTLPIKLEGASLTLTAIPLSGPNSTTGQLPNGPVVAVAAPITALGHYDPYSGDNVITGITVGARWNRPLPQAGTTIDGFGIEDSPATLSTNTPVIEWLERNRITQSSTIYGQTEPTLAPEIGVTYSVEVRDNATNALIHSATGLTGTTYTPPVISEGERKFIVTSIRDTIEAWSKHTAMFIVPAPVTPDPDYNNVILLLHFDQITTDDSPRHYSITAQLDSALTSENSPFGGTALKSDVSNAVEGPVNRGGINFTTSDTGWDFTGDFTFEIRYLTNLYSDGVYNYDEGLMLTVYGDAPAYYTVFKVETYLDQGVIVWVGGESMNCFTAAPLPYGQWRSFSITRQGDTERAFIDGVLVASRTRTISYTHPGPYTIAVSGNTPIAGLSQTQIHGELDEVRITAGVARYTANYTPATAPFPNQ